MLHLGVISVAGWLPVRIASVRHLKQKLAKEDDVNEVVLRAISV